MCVQTLTFHSGPHFKMALFIALFFWPHVIFDSEHSCVLILDFCRFFSSTFSFIINFPTLCLYSPPFLLQFSHLDNLSKPSFSLLPFSLTSLVVQLRLGWKKFLIWSQQQHSETSLKVEPVIGVWNLFECFRDQLKLKY